MKKILALFIVLSILLTACGTAQPDSTGTEGTKSTVLENQNGTADTANGTPTTDGSGEANGTADTTQGAVNTEGAEATTVPNTDGTKPTQGNTSTTPPTESNTKPPQGTTSTTPSTELTEPTTQPTTPTQPITPTQQAKTLTINTKAFSTVSVGGTLQIDYTYSGDKSELTWSSDDTSILTVNSSGVVTGKTAGTTGVIVTNGSITKVVSITVTPPLIINTNNRTTIFVGEPLQIDYTYSGDKSGLTWSSTDTSVLTVNSNGVVTGKAAGEATVKVTNGETTCRISIVVAASTTKTTSIEMNGFNAPLYDGVVKYAGDYMNLRAWTLPVESNRDITVTSSNNSVVSVSWQKDSSNKNDITLNFKSAGSATVTITSGDGAVSKSYSITVKSDYACNPGSGQLTPEQFVNCYNGVVSANGMSTSGMPTGYLVLTLSDSELTWAKARRNAEGGFHAWWAIGYRTMVLTYEGTDENGNHIFYERGY